jgi:hypothetical protein
LARRVHRMQSEAVSYDEDGYYSRHNNFHGHFFGPGERLGSEDPVSVAVRTSASEPRRC